MSLVGDVVTTFLVKHGLLSASRLASLQGRGSQSQGSLPKGAESRPKHELGRQRGIEATTDTHPFVRDTVRDGRSAHRSDLAESSCGGDTTGPTKLRLDNSPEGLEYEVWTDNQPAKIFYIASRTGNTYVHRYGCLGKYSNLNFTITGAQH